MYGPCADCRFLIISCGHCRYPLSSIRELHLLFDLCHLSRKDLAEFDEVLSLISYQDGASVVHSHVLLWVLELNPVPTHWHAYTCTLYLGVHCDFEGSFEGACDGVFERCFEGDFRVLLWVCALHCCVSPSFDAITIVNVPCFQKTCNSFHHHTITLDTCAWCCQGSRVFFFLFACISHAQVMERSWIQWWMRLLG